MNQRTSQQQLDALQRILDTAGYLSKTQAQWLINYARANGSTDPLAKSTEAPRETEITKKVETQVT